LKASYSHDRKQQNLPSECEASHRWGQRFVHRRSRCCSVKPQPPHSSLLCTPGPAQTRPARRPIFRSGSRRQCRPSATASNPPAATRAVCVSAAYVSLKSGARAFASAALSDAPQCVLADHVPRCGAQHAQATVAGPAVRRRRRWRRRQTHPPRHARPRHRAPPWAAPPRAAGQAGGAPRAPWAAPHARGARGRNRRPRACRGGCAPRPQRRACGAPSRGGACGGADLLADAGAAVKVLRVWVRAVVGRDLQGRRNLVVVACARGQPAVTRRHAVVTLPPKCVSGWAHQTSSTRVRRARPRTVPPR